MECTGERYMPEFDGDWTLEHVHRYTLACELAPGKDVLDIASGEGYGARMLADVARHVVGVDIAPEAVERATTKYRVPNLTFKQGSVTAIPLADDAVDLVTSFETIEHLAEHDAMLREIRRVLRPGGLLLISSPDKREYSDIPGFANPYHIKELYREEFEALLDAHFTYRQLFGQRVVFGSVVAAETSRPFLSWRKNEPASRTQGLIDAEYLIALAGDEPLPLLPSGILKTPVAESDLVRKQEAWAAEARTHIKALEALRKELEARIQEVGTWADGVDAHSKEVAAWAATVDAQSKEIAARADAVDAHSEEMTRHNQRLEATVQTMLASRSWRMTTPLRKLGSVLRRLRHRTAPQLQSDQSSGASTMCPVWPPDVRALECTLPLANTAFAPNEKQPSIGVFLHMYYTELAEEMIACVRCLPETAFVHVSTDTEAKRDELLALFAQNGLAERSEIRIFPNKGWDIAPFLVGFAEAIGRYDLILRLHSKRSVQIHGQTGEQWRRMLFAALAGDRNRVAGIVHGFMEDAKLGMVCAPILPYYADCIHFGGNFARMESLLRERGVSVSPDTPIDFPMGSMFWCRPAALRTWLEPAFSFDAFDPTVDDERDGSLAHALERLFFFGCGIGGLKWARVPSLDKPLCE